MLADGQSQKGAHTKSLIGLVRETDAGTGEGR